MYKQMNTDMVDGGCFRKKNETQKQMECYPWLVKGKTINGHDENGFQIWK